MARILVVEDEASNAEVVARFIGRFGHEVKTAWTAETALAELDERPFDAIVLDIMLPGMSGLTFLQEIRSRTKAPVIAMTGYSDLNYKEESIKLGAAAFVTKPIDFKMLELALKDALEGASPS